MITLISIILKTEETLEYGIVDHNAYVEREVDILQQKLIHSHDIVGRPIQIVLSKCISTTKGD